MKQCADCGRPTRGKTGLCKACESNRKAQKAKDKQTFKSAVQSVWERMKK